MSLRCLLIGVGRPAKNGLLCLIAVLLLIPASLGHAQGSGDFDSPEIRALWVDAFHDGFKNPRQVDQLVADARKGNFNTLYVQVRRRGDAYFHNRREPRTEDADLAPGFDALQYVIEKARAEEPRIEVHAWITTIPIWSKKDAPPRDPDHALNRHGPGTDGGEYWLMRRDDGETWNGEGYDLDPGNPDAASHIVTVATALVKNYEIDGLHLDRVRYPEGNPAQRRWGYNMASVARFNDRYQRTGSPDPNDPQWGDWRREQMTALVRRIYVESLAINPKLKLSAAVIPWGRNPTSDADWLRTSAYSAVFQDWRAWLNEGILDVAVTMNYSREDNPSQRQWFDGWIQWAKEQPNNRHVAMGLGAYLNTPAATQDQVGRVRAAVQSGRRVAGVSLYSYAVSNRTQTNDDPTDNVETTQLLSALAAGDTSAGRTSLFNRPAPVPDMAWKSAGDRGHLMLSLGRDFDGARVKLIGQEARNQIADGNGFAGFVDLPTGRYEVTVDHAALGGIKRFLTEVSAAQVTRVD
ncbi:MAG: family 10 glycosylhydrolase [Chloroflexota bacterium]